MVRDVPSGEAAVKNPSRRDAGIGEVPATLQFDHATMSDIAQALAGGQVNATAGYLARIEAYDGDGSAWRHLRRPRLERAHAAASGLRRL